MNNEEMRSNFCFTKSGSSNLPVLHSPCMTVAMMLVDTDRKTVQRGEASHHLTPNA